MFGKSNCKVLDCTKNWIRCQTTSAYTVYQVDNNGVDPSETILFLLKKKHLLNYINYKYRLWYWLQLEYSLSNR